MPGYPNGLFNQQSTNMEPFSYVLFLGQLSLNHALFYQFYAKISRFLAKSPRKWCSALGINWCQKLDHNWRRKSPHPPPSVRHFFALVSHAKISIKYVITVSAISRNSGTVNTPQMGWFFFFIDDCSTQQCSSKFYFISCWPLMFACDMDLFQIMKFSWHLDADQLQYFQPNSKASQIFSENISDLKS